MPKFKYRAVNSIGLAVSGSVNAMNENAAISELNMKGFSKIELRKSSLG